MKTIKVGIEHTGSQTVVVHTADGTITVKPGAKLKDQKILPLTEEKVELYKSKGVKFPGLTKAEEKAGPDVAALTKAVEDAKARHASALTDSEQPGAGEAQAKALKAAADALTAAEKALADAA